MSCEGITVLLAKDVMKPVPPADMKAGFFSPYIIVPKKSGELQPIFGLRILNWAFHKQRLCSGWPEGPVLPCVDLSAPQVSPAVCVRRTGISVQGPALRDAPFTPCVHEGSGGSPCSLERTWHAHSQLPRRLAHTGSVSGSVMRTQGFGALALSQLGFWVNWEKSKLSPMQRISFLGMELDSINQTACLKQELLKPFQRLLGHMATVAAVTPLELLHMRPLQHWLHGQVQRWAWQWGTLRVWVAPACRQTFTLCSDLSFLWAEVPLEQVSRQDVVYTDASAKGWGATFNGLAVSGVWTGPQLHWHINCLELLVVHLALNRLKRCLRGKQVMVRTDKSATVVYINRQGGLRSRRMSQLTRHLFLWSLKHLRSLRAIHIPGLLNRAANELHSPESGDSIPRQSSWFGVVSDSNR